MEKLIINKGYKEYCINDDKNAVIRVSTTDFRLLDRLDKLKGKITKTVKELKKLKDSDSADAVLGAINSAEAEVRQELNEVFGSEISGVVFGDINCLSFAGGQPIVLNFLEAIIPEIIKDLNAEQKAAAAKISKYTNAARQYK